MPEELILHKKKKFIEIISYGEVTKEDIEKSLETVGEIYNKLGITYVLVDTREEISLQKVADLYYSSTSLSEKTREKIRFALLTKEKMSEDLQFLVKVIRNWGGIVEVFISKKDAMNWLKGPENDKPLFKIIRKFFH